MAEAFVQVILDNLSTLIRERIGLILGVDEEMKKLSSTLTTIQAVLEDAEDKQIQSRPIRDWLRKLNVLAYEIDDILDDCNTHVSKLNSSGNRLGRYGLKKILYRLKIGRRMKQVTERLDYVAVEREKFHLRDMLVDRSREAAAAASRETGSLLKEADTIYGRDEDRDKIVKMLVEDCEDGFQMTRFIILYHLYIQRTSQMSGNGKSITVYYIILQIYSKSVSTGAGWMKYYASGLYTTPSVHHLKTQNFRHKF